MRVIAAVLSIALLMGSAGQASALEGLAAFEPPVEGPISDPYRPPRSPYGPGNRGIEYDTEPGQAVSAAGAGTVVFSGWVGGQQFVSIGHFGGLRTTYSWLLTRTVQRGDQVRVGTRLGSAGGRFHFGVRHNGDYIDPALLFGSSPIRVALVAMDKPFGRTFRVRYSPLRTPGGLVARTYHPRCVVVSDCIAFR